ncbi:carbamoyltransferase [Pseudomonadota bacterium]
MNILGLSLNGNNPAACLLRRGGVVAFAEEERFVRIKGAKGLFPINAINYCLKSQKLTIQDIARIAVGWGNQKYRLQYPLFLTKTWVKYQHLSSPSSVSQVFNLLLEQQPGTVKNKINFALRELGHTGAPPPTTFHHHHLTHAASTYYASGFNEAAIIVVDGSGEEISTSIYFGEGPIIKPIKKYTIPNSLGWYYSALVAYLGFKPYEQDGYLMGLASYGKPNKDIQQKFQQIIQIDTHRYQVNPKFTLLGHHTQNEHFSDELIALLGRPRNNKDTITQHHKDIAFATQFHLEEALIELTKRATNNGKIRNLCLAGGVALNCKANGVIYQSGLIDNLFVQPVSHDSGSALGAAMLSSLNQGCSPVFKMSHTYYGPSFSNTQIKTILDLAKIKYSRPKSISKTAAQAIAKNKIIGWFQGKAEVGPRALGARSILANPTNPKIKHTINQNVKFRDSWRPFCPSITKETSQKYFDGGDESHFMIVSHQTKTNLKQSLPSIVHIDNSFRPQIVTKTSNTKYHNLIKELGRITGYEVVLNTSFNVKGEPIVNTPQEALRCYFSTGMDACAIGEFWLEK